MANSRHQTRPFEWIISGILVSWGALILTFPGKLMTNAVNKYLLIIAPEWSWAAFAVTLGVARAYALKRNGNWQRGPAVRLAGAVIGAMFWLTIAGLYLIAIREGVAPFPSLVFYAWFIGIEAKAAWNCGQDSFDHCSFDRKPAHGQPRTVP